MKKSILFIVALALFACKKVPEATEKSQTEILEERFEKARDSLYFWTPDTVLELNPELISVLEDLYQHARDDEFPKEIKTELKWFAEYRKKLCEYYDQHELGSNTLSEYAKADTVINHAERLYAQNEDMSTMGMVVNNGTLQTFNIFHEYNQFEQLLLCCAKDETKELLYQEWNLADSIESNVDLIGDYIAYLQYWGGSIVGPISSGKGVELVKARANMYEKQVNLIRHDKYDVDGVALKNATKFLIECCEASCDTIYNEVVNGFDVPFDDADDYKRYTKDYNEAKYQIKKLRTSLEKWASIWDKLDYELMSDGTRHYSEQVASSMIIRWASIASTN